MAFFSAEMPWCLFSSLSCFPRYYPRSPLRFIITILLGISEFLSDREKLSASVLTVSGLAVGIYAAKVSWGSRLESSCCFFWEMFRKDGRRKASTRRSLQW